MTTIRRIRSLLIGSSLLLAAAVAGAGDGSRAFSASGDGTFHPTGVDANGDGESALFGVATLRTNLGEATSAGWVEFFPWDGATLCGPTHVQVSHRFAERTMRFDDGSRLFLQLVSGTLCFDFLTGASEGSGEVAIVGGTGRLAGASGTLAFRLEAETFPNGLAVLSETFDGSIRLR